MGINYVFSGVSPATFIDPASVWLDLEFEIYDIAFPTTTIYTSGPYSAYWNGQGWMQGWLGSTNESFTLPCSLNLPAAASYALRCKIVSEFITWGDPGPSNPFFIDYGNTPLGTSCVTFIPCDFKIADVLPSPPLSVSSTSFTNETCQGNNDGTAMVSITGGLAPITYLWTPTPGSGQGTPNASGLALGNYSCTITDAMGCDVSANFTVGSNFTATATAIDETCPGDANGSATVNILIGTGPYTYSWNTSPIQTTPTISNLSAGNYICTVTDAGTGCIATVNDYVYSANYDYPNGITISTNTPWTGVNYKINGPVRIKDGATLTIDGGSVIEFGPQGIIRNDNASSGGPYTPSIQPLIVDGATLTGLVGCADNHWEGIFTTGQVVLNNAIIENAEVGLNLHGKFDLGNGTYIFSGKLDMTNSTFRNNQKAIVAYDDVHSSFIIGGTNNLFENTTAIPTSFTNQVTYITMRSSTVFSVSSSTFKNNGIFSGTNRPIAIDYFPIGGGVALTDIIENNIFLDLQQGIVARNSRALNIKGNNFSSVDEGILMIGGILGEIGGIGGANGFQLADAINNDTYAVRLIGTTGTLISTNFFNGVGATGNAYNSYGVIVENTGLTGSTLYNNYFNGADIELQTQGYNPSFKIRCNIFEELGSPAAITAWATLYLPYPSAPANTLMKQGFDCPLTPNSINENQPGNEWQNNCSSVGTTDLILDPSIYFEYKAHDLVNSTGLPTTQPNCSSPTWLGLETCAGVNKTNQSCLNPFAGITVDPDNQFEAYVVEVKNLITTYKNEISALQSTVDGGDTHNLLSAIATQSNGNVKNILLSASPYLSDEVLIAYANSNPTPGHIQQIIVANAPVTSPVIQALNNLNLPKGIINQINATQTGVSERERLEYNISGLEGEIQLLINDLERRFNKRNEKPREKQLLQDMNDVESQKKLANILLEEGDIIGSQVIVNSITQDPVLMSYSENQKFCDLTNCMITMKGQGRALHQITPTEIQVVENVANSNTKIANRAQAILKEVTGTVTNYPIVKISNGNNLRQSNPTLKAELPVQNLKMYPNPSTGMVTIEYDKLMLGKLTIEVYNVLGKKVLNQSIHNHTLDLSNLVNGIYLVNYISSDNQLIDYQKLTIQK